jgi:hypothetical protein
MRATSMTYDILAGTVKQVCQRLLNIEQRVQREKTQIEEKQDTSIEHGTSATDANGSY